MAGFSGAVKIADLSDYIAPSQACVVSLKGNRLNADLLDELSGGEVQIQAPEVVDPTPVKISLHDCLACRRGSGGSGCVTSAETVLLEQQSVAEVENKLRDAAATVVVSLAPQSRAALATHFGSDPRQAGERIAGFLKGLGVRAVLDLTPARDLALLESGAEFVGRFRAAVTDNDAAAAPAQPRHVPMLASACPGWVCYAEKTHGEYVLPYISSTKSPQQVMGTLVKTLLAPRWNLSPKSVYHVTIMPCYDKKLEAAREDFVAAATGAAEVDCVLTSGELLQMMQDRGARFDALPEAPLDSVLAISGAGAPPPQPLPPRGSAEGAGPCDEAAPAPAPAPSDRALLGSGGYLEHIFRHAARELFGVEVHGPLHYKTLRNTDFRETALEVDGKVVLRFAAVYGFRNIQNVLRKIKGARSEYHYVEIMACPAGCLNGGGQLKPAAPMTAKQLLEAVEAAYYHREVVTPPPSENAEVRELYRTALGGGSASAQAKELLHTQYHKREATVSMQISNW